MQILMPIAADVGQIDQRISSVILGSITGVLALGKGFLDYQKNIADMFIDMILHLDILVEYDGRHSKDSKVRAAIVDVYCLILQFCVEASNLFLDKKGKRRNGLRLFMETNWNSFDSKFGDLKKEMSRRLDFFHKINEADFMREQRKHAKQQEFMAGVTYDTVFLLKTQLDDKKQASILEGETRDRERSLQKRQEARKRLMDRLPWPSFVQTQDEKHSRLMPGTATWLLEDARFRAWEQSTESALLWVYGKNGCGKSHLAARVIHDYPEWRTTQDDTANSKKPNTLVYIYCSSLKSTADIDPTRLLGSILKQLCDKLPVSESLPQLEKSPEQSNDPPGISEIKTGISSAASKFSSIFIIVDGLDECHKLELDVFEELCDYLVSLSSIPNATVKTLVLSRPEYPEITKAFTGCSTIQVDDGANADDIVRFISVKTETLLRDPKYHQLLSDIRKIVLSRADGMFLWVNLVIESLKRERVPRKMKEVAENLPKKIGDVYQECLKRVLSQEVDRDLALKTLMWVTNAKRPISRAELKEILAVEPGDTCWDDMDVLEYDEGLPAQCGDLICIIGEHYHLIHSSAKEYLTSLSQKSGLVEEYGSLQASHARLMAETCLTYLSLDIFQSGPMESQADFDKLLETHPFLQYASGHWGLHLEECESQDFDETAMKLSAQDRMRELILQVWRGINGYTFSWPYAGRTTMLHCLSLFDLDRILHSSPGWLSHIAVVDDLGYLPLDYALNYRRRRMTNFLLQAHASEPGQGSGVLETRLYRERLTLAAERNWDEVVRILVSLGHDVNARNGTPLRNAAVAGADKAVAALLDLGADPNLQDDDGDVAVNMAILAQSPNVIKEIIKSAAYRDTPNNRNISALHYAAAIEATPTEITEALLQRGATLDILSTIGETPLYYAAEIDHRNMVRFLIQAGANTEACGASGSTPIMAAAYNGHVESLRILIESGAALDTYDEHGHGPLHLAAKNGHDQAVRLICGKSDAFYPPISCFHKSPKLTLLISDRGVDVGKLTNKGLSPLYMAIAAKQFDVARLLMDQYACDPTQPGCFNANALQLLAITGRTELMSDLLAKGVSPDSSMTDGSTVLHSASEWAGEDFARRLVELAPEVNYTAKDGLGRIPLHISARKGSVGLTKLLLGLGDPDSQIQALDNQANLPLHLAAAEGHMDCVRLLITPNNANSRGKKGGTPLFMAAVKGTVPTVEFLLQHQAQLDLADDQGTTPLVAAIVHENFEVAKLLLEAGANLELADDGGMSPLLAASMYGEAELVKMVLEAGAAPEPADQEALAPLISAIVRGRVDIAKLILEAGANPKRPDAEYLSPLHAAVTVGDEGLIHQLLDMGCDALLSAENRGGMTAFMQAVESNKPDVIDLFMSRNMDGTAIPDRNGRTCLHVAAWYGFIDMFAKLFSMNKDVIYSLDYLNQDVMQFAAGNGRADMVTYLLRRGFPSDGLGTVMDTPLGTAMSGGFYKTANILLFWDAQYLWKPRLPCDRGALHLARGKLRLTQRLLALGVEPSATDALHSTAADYASQDFRETILSLGYPYPRSSSTGRIMELSRTVEKSASAILETIAMQHGKVKAQFDRLWNLELLCNALKSIDTKESIAQSRMCLVEFLAPPPDDGSCSLQIGCNMCGLTDISMIRYDCRRCHPSSTTVCQDCHADLVNEREGRAGRVAAVESLERLETRVFALRLTMRPMTTNSVVFRHPAISLIGVLRMFDKLELHFFSRWIHDRLREYEEWEAENNADRWIQESCMPGYRFLRLVKKALDIKVEPDDINDNGEFSQAAKDTAKQFEELELEHPADRELRFFTCRHRDYMKIPVWEDLNEDERRNFGLDRKLSPEFFEGLQNRYRNTAVDDGSLRSVESVGARETSGESPIEGDSNLRNSPPNDTPSMQNDADTITEGSAIDNNLTQAVLTPSHLGERLSQRSQVQDSVSEQGAQAETKAPLINEDGLSHPTLAPHCIENKDDYRRRLLENKSDLDMAQATLAAILRLIVTDHPYVQFMLSDRVTLKMIAKMTNMMEIDQPLILKAIELEMMWQISQIVLYGFVSEMLVDSLDTSLDDSTYQRLVLVPPEQPVIVGPSAAVVESAQFIIDLPLEFRRKIIKFAVRTHNYVWKPALCPKTSTKDGSSTAETSTASRSTPHSEPEEQVVEEVKNPDQDQVVQENNNTTTATDQSTDDSDGLINENPLDGVNPSLRMLRSLAGDVVFASCYEVFDFYSNPILPYLIYYNGGIVVG
jgi:ankyrin repeat protein